MFVFAYLLFLSKISTVQVSIAESQQANYLYFDTLVSIQ